MKNFQEANLDTKAWQQARTDLALPLLLSIHHSNKSITIGVKQNFKAIINLSWGPQHLAKSKEYQQSLNYGLTLWWKEERSGADAIKNAIVQYKTTYSIWLQLPWTIKKNVYLSKLSVYAYLFTAMLKTLLRSQAINFRESMVSTEDLRTVLLK